MLTALSNPADLTTRPVELPSRGSVAVAETFQVQGLAPAKFAALAMIEINVAQIDPSCVPVTREADRPSAERIIAPARREDDAGPAMRVAYCYERCGVGRVI